MFPVTSTTAKDIRKKYPVVSFVYSANTFWKLKKDCLFHVTDAYVWVHAF